MRCITLFFEFLFIQNFLNFDFFGLVLGKMIQVVEKDSPKIRHLQLLLFEYDLIMLRLLCFLSFQGCSLTLLEGGEVSLSNEDWNSGDVSDGNV